VTRLALLFLVIAANCSQELRPGVWAGHELKSLPLPAPDYDIYLLGEVHGVVETLDVFSQWLAILHERAGLRDVALEDQPAWQREAQAYVDRARDALPEALCLRAGIFEALRRFNAGRAAGDRLRVHLVDLDFSPAAIRQHLLNLKGQIPGAVSVRVPEIAAIRTRGLQAVDALERLTADPRLLAELRTVRHSIRASQQGFEADNGPVKGSPYLDDREEAIRENLSGLLPAGQKPVLALYGADHVSRGVLHNGGPRQDREFAPLALRLERSGIKLFTLIAYPLAGRMNWRRGEEEMIWTAADAKWSDGATLEHVPPSTFLYVDPRREAVDLTRDLTAARPDAFIVWSRGSPAANACAAAKR
jgi:hypothetical protein